MTAAAYARYSSDNQREESIDAQLRAIREYAEREHITIVKIYVDEARSATNDNRPEFQRMMADAVTGEFQAVIVHKLDRFSRDRYDSAFYKRLLKKQGIRLISVLENLDDSPESVILESVLEGMAEYYSKNLAREVRKGMKENALKAKHNGGIPPLGYDVTPDKKYILNQTEAMTVRLIFELYAQGYGYGKIINELNARGLKTKRGKPFGKNSIADILRNEKYIGRYVFNKRLNKDSNRKYKPDEEIIRIDGAMPAIIDIVTWNKVQEILKGRKRMPRQDGKRTYILTGKIVCGECGAAYVGGGYVGGRGGKKYYQYQCTGRKKNCDNRAVRQDAIEQYVLDEIKIKLLTDEQIEKIANMLIEEKQKKEAEKGAVLPELKKQYTMLKEKMSKLYDLYVEGGIDKDSLIDKINAWQAEAEGIKNKIQVYEQMQSPSTGIERIKKYLRSQRRCLENADPKTAQRMVETFVDKIIVFKDRFDLVLRVDSDNAGGGEGS